MVLATSALLTLVSFFSLRMRPGAFVPSRWRLPECMRRILPVAVTLKRFAAPRCVFNFFFGFEAFLGIAKTFLAWHQCAQFCVLKSKRPPRKAAATTTALAVPVALSVWLPPRLFWERARRPG